MKPKLPQRGAVFVYPYRWAREARDDRSPDGAKTRTVCMILSFERSDGRHVLYLLAISSKPPRADQVAIPIPDIERRRAGLRRYLEAWIYVSELNRDIAEDSYYYQPNPRPWAFSAPPLYCS